MQATEYMIDLVTYYKGKIGIDRLNRQMIKEGYSPMEAWAALDLLKGDGVVTEDRDGIIRLA